MKDAIKVDIPNDSGSKVKFQLQEVFQSCDSEFQNIISKIAYVLAGEMQDQAPLKTGILRDSIGRFKSKKNIYFMWVGPTYTNKRSYNKGFGGNHAHLVEYGTKERYMKKGLLPGGFTRESNGEKKFTGKSNSKPFAGKNVGAMTANPFIRRTYDIHGNFVLETIKKATILAIEKQAKQQGL